MLIAFLLSAMGLQSQDVVIGSKLFSESRLLGEIMAQTIESQTDLTVERKFGLGGSLIAFEALKSGSIDIYPEYTGTISEAILKESGDDFEDDLNALGIRSGKSFGFNNSYILIAQENTELSKISDLKNETDLRLGFSNEFVKRGDGFTALNEFYLLNLPEPKGMDHGLAYRALADDQIDVTDAYSTDGKLREFGFKHLEDDRNFFPEYLALPLIRSAAIERHPEIIKILGQINISAEKMQELNYLVEVEKVPIEEVAYNFLLEKNLVTKGSQPAFRHPIITQTIEHLQLTLLATLIAILIAVPLGIYISHEPRMAKGLLAATGVIQTIPSLALLGFMIPLFGIGFTPAIIALLLYALLPIVRNTYAGLQGTDPILIEAGKALGMTKWQILKMVRLPLAASFIMSGIRTALTINIGTATLAAFIGAGGLGESIITGINLNDNSIILQGAIPAALLALIADWGMG
ncbi:MAG: glycine betaine ABC transporter substrate-binding protein, partial [Cryomorphaceae bacterium]